MNNLSDGQTEGSAEPSRWVCKVPPSVLQRNLRVRHGPLPHEGERHAILESENFRPTIAIHLIDGDLSILGVHLPHCSQQQGGHNSLGKERVGPSESQQVVSGTPRDVQSQYQPGLYLGGQVLELWF